MRIHANYRKTMGDAIKADFDGGIVKIYDDSAARPAGPATAVPGGSVLLATLTLNATAFGSAAGTGDGDVTLTAGAVTGDSSADASGNPLWARIYESDGTTPITDVSVGKTGGSEELLINTVDGGGDPYIAAGGPVAMSSLVLHLGLGT